MAQTLWGIGAMLAVGGVIATVFVLSAVMLSGRISRSRGE